jgi:hypothetical protein
LSNAIQKVFFLALIFAVLDLSMELKNKADSLIIKADLPIDKSNLKQPL